VVASSIGGWKPYWKTVFACRIQKDAIRMKSKPSLRSPRLERTTLDCGTEPTRPIDFQRLLRGEQTVLIGEDDYVVAHHDDEIADLLLTALITVWSRVTPQRKKVLFA
jgi:hypothetical protein